jgi:AraC-like DNA-binding protein
MLPAISQSAANAGYENGPVLPADGIFPLLRSHVRIKAAELLLVNQDISVTDAAMQSGFSSLTTFNRVFRDQKGCTPSEFRRLYRIDNYE